MAFDLATYCQRQHSCNEATLTFSLRHATHAVIFLLISGSFLSPKDSRIAAAADGADVSELLLMVETGILW